MFAKDLLRKVISGGQTGADQAGLFVAKRFGLETGGTIPRGFKTLVGNCPELGEKYGLVEDASDSYVPRTRKNVANSDGTVRLAGDWNSRGELLTKSSIDSLKKPFFDVDLSDFPPVEDFVNWIERHQIRTLNVAGNSNQTFRNCGALSAIYLTQCFFKMGLEMHLSDEDIFGALCPNLDSKSLVLTDRCGSFLDRVSIRQVERRI